MCIQPSQRSRARTKRLAGNEGFLHDLRFLVSQSSLLAPTRGVVSAMADELVLGPVAGERVARRTREGGGARVAGGGTGGVGLHEARHTFASLMIAAGVNAKALPAYLGHASVTITLDRYGHLMPGNEVEAPICLTPSSQGRIVENEALHRDRGVTRADARVSRQHHPS